jgi:beta-lactamase class A
VSGAPTADSALDDAVGAVRRASGTVSVVLRVSGEDVPRTAIEPDAQHYAASTMKLPVLVAAQRLAERGELDPDRTVLVHDDFDSLVPGRRFTMDPAEDSDPETWAAVGAGVPLRELVERMVTVSGNLATDLVLEQVGPGEIATVLRLAGCSPHTVLPRGIEDYPARDAGLDNLVTADDLARLMVALADGLLAGPAASAECERILRAQTYRAGIPAGLRRVWTSATRPAGSPGSTTTSPWSAHPAGPRSAWPCWSPRRGRPRNARPASPGSPRRSGTLR